MAGKRSAATRFSAGAKVPMDIGAVSHPVQQLFAASSAAFSVVALTIVLAVGAGCGTAKVAGGNRRELVLAYDDSRSTSTVAFPSTTYESVTRFELPAGEHRPLRLRLQAEAAGSLAITIYDSTPLETPGDAIISITRELDKQDLSDGRDGRWVVEDLMDTKPLKGVVWVGIRKTAGQPTLWSSAVSSGQCYIRNSDPQNLLGLLPTRRTPMVRLEVSP